MIWIWCCAKLFHAEKAAERKSYACEGNLTTKNLRVGLRVSHEVLCFLCPADVSKDDEDEKIETNLAKKCFGLHRFFSVADIESISYSR